MAIAELGHTGLHVYDLDAMRAFYADVLGLIITDEDPALGLVFLSSRPDHEHHELVLAKGRTVELGARLVNQISWRVDDVDSLKDLYGALVAAGADIEHVVTHGNAIGVYFFDPECNKLEIYWNTGRAVAQPFRKPIGIDGSADEIVTANDRLIAEPGPRF